MAVLSNAESSIGYHYTRQQLDEFDDPDEAHARRGAHWTFDGAAFVKKMQELQNKGDPDNTTATGCTLPPQNVLL